MLGNNVAIDRGVKDALILRLGAILGIIFRILVETARDPILGGERGAAAPFPLDADQPTVPAARPLNRWRNFRRRITVLVVKFAKRFPTFPRSSGNEVFVFPGVSLLTKAFVVIKNI